MQIPKVEKTDNLTVFSSLLGSAPAKAAHKMLMKLTLGVNFINVICTIFSYERRFFYLQVTRENNVCTKNLYLKR